MRVGPCNALTPRLRVLAQLKQRRLELEAANLERMALPQTEDVVRAVKAVCYV